MTKSPEIHALILKSERALKSAQTQMEEGDFDFAVSRFYYSMYYAAEALLLTKNLSASKHSGLLSLFYEHFIKTGLIERSLHQNLHQAFDLRQQVDDWSDSGISQEIANAVEKTARDFIAVIRKFIEDAFDFPFSS